MKIKQIRSKIKEEPRFTHQKDKDVKNDCVEEDDRSSYSVPHYKSSLSEHE